MIYAKKYVLYLFEKKTRLSCDFFEVKIMFLYVSFQVDNSRYNTNSGIPNLVDTYNVKSKIIFEHIYTYLELLGII